MLFLPKEGNKNLKWLRIIVASFFIVIIFVMAVYLIFEKRYKTIEEFFEKEFSN